jgi:hypothetical protein
MFASLTHFRRRVGAFIGGFGAGLANRRLRGFQPSRAHLNTLIAAAGPDITARARWLTGRVSIHPCHDVNGRTVIGPTKRPLNY